MPEAGPHDHYMFDNNYSQLAGDRSALRSMRRGARCSVAADDRGQAPAKRVQLERGGDSLPAVLAGLRVNLLDETLDLVEEAADLTLCPGSSINRTKRRP